MLLQDMLGVDSRAHGAKERCERGGEDALHGVIIQCSHGHWALLPDPRVLVQKSELEGSSATSRNVVVVDDAVECEFDIVGRKGRTIVPSDVTSDVKGPGQAVVGVVP